MDERSEKKHTCLESLKKRRKNNAYLSYVQYDKCIDHLSYLMVNS